MFNFIGGDRGAWRVAEMRIVCGASLAAVAAVEIVPGNLVVEPSGVGWILRGATSNHRYTTRAEKNALNHRQAGLSRPPATCAALIPIRKSAAWWELAQDERREILETRSKHIEIGLKYLPEIARRLHHSRDFGEEFDFLTWFEYAPADARKFEELVCALRETEEWHYVEREIDVRLARDKF